MESKFLYLLFPQWQVMSKVSVKPCTQPPRCPALGKKCNKCNKERHFVQVCKELAAEGSQLAAVEQRPPKNHNVHAYFGSVELGSVSST